MEEINNQKEKEPTKSNFDAKKEKIKIVCQFLNAFDKEIDKDKEKEKTLKKSILTGYLIDFFDFSEYDKLIKIVDFLTNSEIIQINLKREATEND